MPERGRNVEWQTLVRLRVNSAHFTMPGISIGGGLVREGCRVQCLVAISKILSSNLMSRESHSIYQPGLPPTRQSRDGGGNK